MAWGFNYTVSHSDGTMERPKNNVHRLGCGLCGRIHNVPPAGPDIVGQQGCGLCGRIEQSRKDMLRHYREFHNTGDFLNR